MFRRRLHFALAISLCLHLLILFPPYWRWHHSPSLPEIARLDVFLKETPPAQPVLSPPPLPAEPPALPVPPQIASVPAPVVENVPSPVILDPPSETPFTPEDETEMADTIREDGAGIAESVEENTTTQSNDMLRPSSGTMRYTVYRGDQGFEVGRATVQWQVGDGRYRLGLHTETSGLAALLYPVEAYAESMGSFDSGGLRPDRYMLESNDGEPAETVEFYWETRQIQIGQRDPEPLHSGSQDILSLQYQFAYMVSPLSAAIGWHAPLEFWVASDKRYRLMRFDIVGEEILELPAGRFLTLHLQSVSNGKMIDFWLAEDYQMLPVKTRFTDKNGDIYEQAVREIALEPFDDSSPTLPPLPESQQE
jgi:hypothetical protein